MDPPPPSRRFLDPLLDRTVLGNRRPRVIISARGHIMQAARSYADKTIHPPRSGPETQAVVLGWHDSHCASAVLLAPSGRILYGAAEERFLRKKLYKGFPAQTIADIRARLGDHTVAVAYQDLPADTKILRNLGLAWHSWRQGLNSVKSIAALAGTTVGRIVRGRPSHDPLPKADTL